MDTTRIIGLVSTVFIVGFLVFAFRQGLRVKPEHREDRGPSVGVGPDYGSGGGHGGHG
jgi:hypothetical protein